MFWPWPRRAWMQLARLLRWAAILSAPPLHVMFVAGGLTLFYHPLMRWEEPLAQEDLVFDSYQALLEAAAPPVGDFHLYLPEQGRGHPGVAYRAPGADTWQGRWVTRAEAIPRRENLAGFLYDLHFFWHLRTGMALQNAGALCAIVFTFALLGGVCVVRRSRAALRLTLQGVLLPHAYTGAVMLLSPVLIAGAVGPVFGEDLARAVKASGYFGEALAEDVERPPGAPAAALPLDELVQRALGHEPRLSVESFAFHDYGRTDGTVAVRGSVSSGRTFEDRLVRHSSVLVGTADGRVLEVSPPDSEAAAAWAARWTKGIHYLAFGGVALRVASLLLVLFGSAAFLAGNWVWLDRRSRAMRGGWRLPLVAAARLTVGVGAGTFVAVSALFLASRALPMAWSCRGVLEELTFTAALGGCILWAFAATDGWRCCERQLTLAGALLAVVPPLAALSSDAGLFGRGRPLPDVLGVDLALHGGAVVLVGTAVALHRANRDGWRAPREAGSVWGPPPDGMTAPWHQRRLAGIGRALLAPLATLPPVLLAAAAWARWGPLSESARCVLGLFGVLPLWFLATGFATRVRSGGALVLVALGASIALGALLL
jgi:uncharacterized iron-regulated membrane protein